MTTMIDRWMTVNPWVRLALYAVATVAGVIWWAVA
jgi:hypothetical protein